MPYDFKKEYKDLYLPATHPSLLTVPPIPFFMIDGTGAPADTAYTNAVEALYALTYTIKMSKMSGQQPAGYIDYVVPPLEGLWDSGTVGLDADRSKWQWTSMIRQPDFVTDAVFRWALDAAAKKKPEVDFSRVRFATYDEGLCVQMMHIGPFSTEQATIDAISAFIAQNGLVDDCGIGFTARRHHEIYLGDPRRLAPEKLKTVLRHPVRKNG